MELSLDIEKLLAKLGQSNPYKDFDAGKIPQDMQGWGSEHPYFPTLISMTKPKQIIEVGTWKGASAIGMARHALAINPDVKILCVDTWLGSNEALWTDPKLRELLQIEHGYPTMYKQFLANIIHEKLTRTIFPLPMTSISAAETLAKYDVKAELIYIDAAHGEYEVYGDLIHYWPLVRPGGIMFGDDYWNTWPGVIKSVNRFAYEQGLGLETNSGKWFLVKPA
jgi:predicted O-methyltransferase YrrM